MLDIASAFSVKRQRLKPLVATKRSLSIATGEHDAQADNRTYNHRDRNERHESHHKRSLKLSPSFLFVPEALVLVFRHKRLAKSVADYRHRSQTKTKKTLIEKARVWEF